MSGTLPTDHHDVPFSWSGTANNKWISTSNRKTETPIFFLALVISLLIHAAILQWRAPAASVKPIEVTVPPIYITLNHLAPPDTLSVDSSPTQDGVVESIVETAVELIADHEVAVVNELNAIVRELSPEDLQAIIQQQDINNLSSQDLFSSQLLSENSTSLSESPQGSNNFNNVFDPRLRARLQSNAVRHQSVTSTVGNETINAHGNTFVDLGGGRCLMGASAGFNQETNWFLTKCPDYKDEGERMMERVSKEVENKFGR